ncbi:hypothetical protein [Litchfieldella xinjiangensis]|uniref:hypothetical protein n=1 Tax=Litchfieldella xinjiangensis TaxID=1166948 RepID=UPI0005BC75D8|nr:hypothetical protein [Halomonas xinjiangensis]
MTPDLSRAAAQSALVRRMLLEHGREKAVETFLFERRLYRITVERVPPEEIPEAAREFLREHHDADV